MRSTVRTFVAIDISPGIRSEIQKVLRPLKEQFPAIKWVDEFQFHVTLKFLGDVPTNELHEVIAAIQKGCRSIEPFDIVLNGLGAFPSPASPRTLWVGVSDGMEEVQHLAEQIDHSLHQIGYPLEARRFTPHLTLGRAKQVDRRKNPPFEETLDPSFSLLSRLIQERDDVYFGCCDVEEVVIYSSELSRFGPKYDVLTTVGLSEDTSLDSHCSMPPNPKSPCSKSPCSKSPCSTTRPLPTLPPSSPKKTKFDEEDDPLPPSKKNLQEFRQFFRDNP